MFLKKKWDLFINDSKPRPDENLGCATNFTKEHIHVEKSKKNNSKNRQYHDEFFTEKYGIF